MFALITNFFHISCDENGFRSVLQIPTKALFCRAAKNRGLRWSSAKPFKIFTDQTVKTLIDRALGGCCYKQACGDTFAQPLTWGLQIDGLTAWTMKKVNLEASVIQPTYEIHYKPESRARTFHLSARLIHSAHRIHVYVDYWNSNMQTLNFHNCFNKSSRRAHVKRCNEKEIKLGLEAPDGSRRIIFSY